MLSWAPTNELKSIRDKASLVILSQQNSNQTALVTNSNTATAITTSTTTIIPNIPSTTSPISATAAK